MNRLRTTSLAIVSVALLLTVTACSRRTDSNQTGAPATPDLSSVGSVPGSTPPGSSTAGVGSSPAVRPAVAPKAQTTDGTVKTPDGQERTYHLYVPASLPTGPVPLLVALHGGGGNGPQFEENSGFDGIAEANGFIVVYPDGTKIPALPNSRTWNGGGCCPPADESKQNVDDVTFVSMLIDQLEAAHDIDRSRVFATGHSNGAIMSYRLACELADKIDAIAVQAGTVFVANCAPSHPISALEIHGTADQNIPIDGGTGDRSISRSDFPAPLGGLHTLAAADGCPAQPVETTDASNSDLTIDTWEPCTGGATVAFVKVTGANHAWMGHPATKRASAVIVGDPYQKFDSSMAVWSFLAGHPRR